MRSLVTFIIICLVVLGACMNAEAVLFRVGGAAQDQVHEIDTTTNTKTYLGWLLTDPTQPVRGLAVDSYNEIQYACGWGKVSAYPLVWGEGDPPWGGNTPLSPIYLMPAPDNTQWGGMGLECIRDGTETRLFAVVRRDTAEGWRGYLLEFELDGNLAPSGIKSETAIVDLTDPGNPVPALYPYGLAFHEGTQKFYTSDEYMLWEIGLDGVARKTTTHMSPISGLAYAEDGELYAATQNVWDTLAIYNLDTGDFIHVASQEEVGWNEALCSYYTPTTAGGPLPGDVDGNGVVDGLDLTAVLTAWETTPGDPLWDPDADLDDNNIVDGLDLTEVISNWTTGAGTPGAGTPLAAATVPEASSRGKGNAKRASGNAKGKK